MTLKEYLLKKNMTAIKFAKEYAKLDPHTIYKAYHGCKVRIDSAKRIVRATKKAVTLEDLGYASK